jgi:hypothetical protein
MIPTLCHCRSPGTACSLDLLLEHPEAKLTQGILQATSGPTSEPSPKTPNATEVPDAVDRPRMTLLPERLRGPAPTHQEPQPVAASGLRAPASPPEQLTSGPVSLLGQPCPAEIAHLLWRHITTHLHIHTSPPASARVNVAFFPALLVFSHAQQPRPMVHGHARPAHPCFPPAWTLVVVSWRILGRQARGLGCIIIPDRQAGRPMRVVPPRPAPLDLSLALRQGCEGRGGRLSVSEQLPARLRWPSCFAWGSYGAASSSIMLVLVEGLS